MIRQISLTEFESHDKITLYARNRQCIEGKLIEISVWDDYEGRGCSVGLCTIEELDSLIKALVEIRKEML